MTSEGLGEVFKGDSADMCAGKFLLVSMGGRADCQACADGERGPPWRERKFLHLFHTCTFVSLVNICECEIFLE